MAEFTISANNLGSRKEKAVNKLANHIFESLKKTPQNIKDDNEVYLNEAAIKILCEYCDGLNPEKIKERGWDDLGTKKIKQLINEHLDSGKKIRIESSNLSSYTQPEEVTHPLSLPMPQQNYVGIA